MTKTIDTEIELLKLQYINMQNDLTEIKTDLKANHKEVLEVINWLDNKFATKIEHKENVKRIDMVIKIWWSLGFIVMSTVLVSLLKWIII